LYLSVNKKLVSQNAVTVGQVEGQRAIVWIEVLVVEHHRNVEVGKAWKAKARGFVAGVKLIKEQVKTGQALGYLEPGDQVELLLYDFETPIDPRKYMNCRQ